MLHYFRRNIIHLIPNNPLFHKIKIYTIHDDRRLSTHPFGLGKTIYLLSCSTGWPDWSVLEASSILDSSLRLIVHIYVYNLLFAVAMHLHPARHATLIFIFSFILCVSGQHRTPYLSEKCRNLDINIAYIYSATLLPVILLLLLWHATMMCDPPELENM